MIQFETGFLGTAYDLTTPRIGAFPIAGTVTASTEEAGFAGDNANNALTYTFWKPTADPSTWQLSFTSQTVSYCGIAAHNIGSLGGQVAVQEWNGSAWVGVRSFGPTDDGPIMFLFTPRTTDRIRIRIAGCIPTIGVIWFGSVTEFPRKAQWTGSVPFNEVINSVYTDNVSDGGHVLDRFATRKAGIAAMEVQNLSETWVAANLPALQTHMASLPIFMADRPNGYRYSIVFGMATEPLRVERTRPVLGAARSLTINVSANEPT